MTGSLSIQQLVQRHSKMIAENSKASIKNQQLLNRICHELTLSLCYPLLEFVDVLLEKFMYPESTEEDFGNSPSRFSLGHPRLLELVYLRQRIVRLQELNHEHFRPISKFFAYLLNGIEEIHSILVHLLRVLSNHIEIPKHSKFYRKIVTESISDFQRAFEQLKYLDYTLLLLMSNFEKTCSTDKTFSVDASLLQGIKRFDTENNRWFQDILEGSRALIEFGQQIKEKKGKSDIIIFLRNRKSKLNICHRRVF